MDNITSVALLDIVVACVGAIIGHATPDQVDEIMTSERPYLSCVLYFVCTLINCGLKLVLLICSAQDCGAVVASSSPLETLEAQGSTENLDVSVPCGFC